MFPHKCLHRLYKALPSKTLTYEPARQQVIRASASVMDSVFISCQSDQINGVGLLYNLNAGKKKASKILLFRSFLPLALNKTTYNKSKYPCISASKLCITKKHSFLSWNVQFALDVQGPMINHSYLCHIAIVIIQLCCASTSILTTY